MADGVASRREYRSGRAAIWNAVQLATRRANEIVEGYSREGVSVKSENKNSFAIVVCVLGVSFLLLVAVAAGIAIKRSRDDGGVEGGRAAKTEPVSGFKSHKDLADHLKNMGVEVQVAHAGVYDKPERPAAWFRDKDNGHVMAYLCKDELAAEEVSGSMGEGAITVGRFAIGRIHTDRENTRLLARIRAALGR